MKTIRVVLTLSALLFTATARAQFSAPSPENNLKASAMPRLPAGSKAAIVVFEDLGCPACAYAHAFEVQAAEKAHVPLLRFDFPIEAHIWTFQGAVCARYLQEKVSPKLAEEYRAAVFASQRNIASKDDLQQFTQQWMQRHGQQMPFVMDPDHKLANAVRSDYELGLRLNVQYTPTIVVVTGSQYQVICGTRTGASDPTQILPAVQAALAQPRPHQ